MNIMKVWTQWTWIGGWRRKKLNLNWEGRDYLFYRFGSSRTSLQSSTFSWSENFPWIYWSCLCCKSVKCKRKQKRKHGYKKGTYSYTSKHKRKTTKEWQKRVQTPFNNFLIFSRWTLCSPLCIPIHQLFWRFNCLGQIYLDILKISLISLSPFIQTFSYRVIFYVRKISKYSLFWYCLNPYRLHLQSFQSSRRFSCDYVNDFKQKSFSFFFPTLRYQKNKPT